MTHGDDAHDPRALPSDAVDIDPALPVALAATRPKRREPEELSRHDFARLKGQEVLVHASGFQYRGVLVGADETELYLRSETRWWVLPLERVTSVGRAKRALVPPAAPPGFDEARQAPKD